MQDFVTAALDSALAPGRFFVAGASLAWRHDPAERLRWEIFRGHLLGGGQTRAEAEFDTHSVLFYVPGEERPQHAISLRTSAAEGRVYVTRELWIQGEETYEPAPNVIDTRPALVLERELVGTIDLSRFADADSLAAELERYVLLALTGTSRLPITSVESPLPAFSFGRWGYLPGGRTPPASPIDEPSRWIERGVAAADAEPGGAGPGAGAGPAGGPPRSDRGACPLLARTERTARVRRCGYRENDPRLFNQISLTPYTGLVDNLLALGERLVELGAVEEPAWVDLIGFMLRQLTRHLAAFDLVTFHNQGANYPDALLIESLIGGAAAAGGAAARVVLSFAQRFARTVDCQTTAAPGSAWGLGPGTRVRRPGRARSADIAGRKCPHAGGRRLPRAERAVAARRRSPPAIVRARAAAAERGGRHGACAKPGRPGRPARIVRTRDRTVSGSAVGRAERTGCRRPNPIGLVSGFQPGAGAAASGGSGPVRAEGDAGYGTIQGKSREPQSRWRGGRPIAAALVAGRGGAGRRAAGGGRFSSRSHDSGLA